MNKIIKKIIDERQTVKEYNDKKISEYDWNQIMEMIHWTPSSSGYEPYKVLVIDKDHPIRQEINPIAYNQKPVVTGDKLVFFVIRSMKDLKSEKTMNKRVEAISKLTGNPSEDDINKMKEYYKVITKKMTPEKVARQAYIAVGNASVAATILGIGSTIIEGFDPSQLNELLLEKEIIQKNEFITLGIVFGYKKSNTSFRHMGTGKRWREDKKIKFIELKK